MVANALISSRLDYGTSFFCSLCCKNITRLQNIQNCALVFPDFLTLLQSYSYISTLPLASQNTLFLVSLYIHLLLKQDIVIQKRFFSKFPSAALQFINLKFISTSVFHMMLQNFGMICHWKFELLLHYQVSKGDLKLMCSRSLFHPRFSYYRTLIVPW